MWENAQSYFHKQWSLANSNSTDAPLHELNGYEKVNGVVLPAAVAAELRRLGIELSWYSAAELQAAIQACIIDEQLIDDPNGTSFIDMLNLSEEKLEHQLHSPLDAFRLPMAHVFGHEFHHGLHDDDWNPYGHRRENDEHSEQQLACA